MTDTVHAVPTMDLRPVGLYDTGREMLRPDVDSAVESMLTTGCEVHVYEKRTLMSLYKNVSRRNSRRKPGSRELRLWTHRTPDPSGEYPHRWLVRVRQEQEEINPFFQAGQESRYGRWLPLAERLLLGEAVQVGSSDEVVKVGQSFRNLCDKRGYRREGRVLQCRQEGEAYVIVANNIREIIAVSSAGRATTKAKRPAKKKK